MSSIEIVAEARGRGLGTASMADVMARADLLGVGLQLQVFKSNAAAQRLYERLGVRPGGQSDTHIQMAFRR